MRKVVYQLNSLVDPMPGYFHCWAGTMQDAYAVIEDTMTGKLTRLNEDQFRFVMPPDEKTGTKETGVNDLLKKAIEHFIFDESQRSHLEALEAFKRTIEYIVS